MQKKFSLLAIGSFIALFILMGIGSMDDIDLPFSDFVAIPLGMAFWVGIIGFIVLSIRRPR